MEFFLSEQIDRCKFKTNMDEINWSNHFYTDMFSCNFDRRFSTVDLKKLSGILLLTQLIGNRTSCRIIQG